MSRQASQATRRLHRRRALSYDLPVQQVADALASFADELNRVAGDGTLDPAQRVAALRSLRDELAFLLGSADRYLGTLNLQREAAAIGRVRERVAARESADAREAVLDQGLLAPEVLDAAGVPSHEELDGRIADGTIEEALIGLVRPFSRSIRPKRRSGLPLDRALKGRVGNGLSGGGDQRPFNQRAEEALGR
jgi:hypothetical protein